MGLEELAKELNRVDVEYRGDRIKIFKSSNRALKIAFKGNDDDLRKNTFSICDYVVYSLRESGINLSLYQSDFFEIVQGTANPIRGQRKTIFEVSYKKGEAVFNISSTAPRAVAGYRPEEILYAIANHISRLKL